MARKWGRFVALIYWYFGQSRCCRT